MDWETRKSQRLQVSGTVWIQINPSMQDSVQLEKEAVEVDLVDLSVHGGGLLSKTFLPKGTVVDLEFPGAALTVPKAAHPAGIIRITAKVMYSRPQGDVCRMGLLITDMDDETRRVVRDFAFSRELRRTPRTPLP
jgi:c-di-GMP-binding flagellar brake protein YcgR